MKALVDTRKNPCDTLGVDIAQIGLSVPLRPPLISETPRPLGPSLEHSTGYSFGFSLVFHFLCLVLLLTT